MSICIDIACALLFLPVGVDDMEYLFYMDRIDYLNENGYPKDDAVSLTEDELAVFDKFINSIRKK